MALVHCSDCKFLIAGTNSYFCKHAGAVRYHAKGAKLGDPCIANPHLEKNCPFFEQAPIEDYEEPLFADNCFSSQDNDPSLSDDFLQKTLALNDDSPSEDNPLVSGEFWKKYLGLENSSSKEPLVYCSKCVFLDSLGNNFYICKNEFHYLKNVDPHCAKKCPHFFEKSNGVEESITQEELDKFWKDMLGDSAPSSNTKENLFPNTPLDDLARLGKELEEQAEISANVPRMEGVFDLSKPIYCITLMELCTHVTCLPDLIEKKKAEVRVAETSIPSYDPNYVASENIQALREKYRKKAKWTLFSSTQKLTKLRKTPEYREELHKTKLADEEETQKYHEQVSREKSEAEQELFKLRVELAKLKEEMRFYRPLYDRCIYWAQEARRIMSNDAYPDSSLQTIANHACLCTAIFETDLPDKLLERAMREFADRENNRAFEKLMKETDELIKKHRLGEDYYFIIDD